MRMASCGFRSAGLPFWRELFKTIELYRFGQDRFTSRFRHFRYHLLPVKNCSRPLQSAPGIKHQVRYQVWPSSPVETLLSQTETRTAARSAEFSKDHNRRNKRLSR
jgi:hypothetical protein